MTSEQKQQQLIRIDLSTHKHIFFFSFLGGVYAPEQTLAVDVSHARHLQLYLNSLHQLNIRYNQTASEVTEGPNTLERAPLFILAFESPIFTSLLLNFFKAKIIGILHYLPSLKIPSQPFICSRQGLQYHHHHAL